MLLVGPGNHLLIVQGWVKFSTGEIWRSTFTVIPVSIPDKASKISTILVTKVSRDPAEGKTQSSNN
jgi:hypothetical protein